MTCVCVCVKFRQKGILGEKGEGQDISEVFRPNAIRENLNEDKDEEEIPPPYATTGSASAASKQHARTYHGHFKEAKDSSVTKGTAAKALFGTVLGSSASSAQGHLCKMETLLGPGGTDQLFLWIHFFGFILGVVIRVNWQNGGVSLIQRSVPPTV